MSKYLERYREIYNKNYQEHVITLHGFEDMLISDLSKTEELLSAVATMFCEENYL